MKRGYCRVSTQDQDLGRQIAALEQAGCEMIYQEKISGAKSSRPELDRMLKDLQPGDTVVIQKLDRLGRSLSHLLHLVQTFKERQTNFVVLGQNIDTTTPMGMVIFSVIGAFAQFEREMIRERVMDGLKHTKSKGTKLGRRPKPGADIIALHSEGMSVAEISSKLNVSRPTVYKILGAN